MPAAYRRQARVACAARGKAKGSRSAPNASDSWELKQAALDRVLADIERNFGKGSLIKLGEESSDRTVYVTTWWPSSTAESMTFG